jgi:hypothetical protein
LRFQAFKDGLPIKELDLSGSYLFGSDGITVRKAQIGFKNGYIQCESSNLQTAGLALRWPVKDLGKVLLPTTTLPDRERPYNLNVEIARGKLMQIVTKCEDWSFFNDGGTGKDCDGAQSLFIQAMESIADMPRAAKLADEALVKAVAFADKLAMVRADAQFRNRGANHGFGKGCLGCQIDPAQVTNRQYLTRLFEVFGSVKIPANWGQIEKEKGQYDFKEFDACVEVFMKRRLNIGGGPLLCFKAEYLPEWLVSKRTNFEKVRESAYRFVSEMVGRYAGVIRNWTVVSGLNCFNHFGFGFEQILEITRAANMAAKAADSRARKVIEIQNPWGEYYATSAGTIPPLVYIDMVVQGGIAFDSFALAMRFGGGNEEMQVRDIMQISALLDNLVLVGKPFSITDVTTPAVAAGGSDVSTEKRWLEKFYRIALSKPFVDSVVYSSLTDSLTRAGLLTGKLEPKETYAALKDLHKTIFGRQ